MLAATLLFAGMNAAAKALGTGYSALQLIFFRNLFALLPLAVALIRRNGSVAQLHTRRPLGHALRAVAGLASLACFFYSYARLPLATVSAISFAAPFCVATLSRPLLGEPVGRRRLAGIVIGFVGILVIVRPTARLELAVAAAIAATLLYALVMIFMRQLNRTEQPAAIVFYYLISSVALSGVALPVVWTTPDLTGWLLFLSLGLFGGFAQLAMTIAFRHGDAALVAPFDYATILWSTLIGGFGWHEWPGPRLWLGIAIVVGSGLWLARTEGRHTH
jgi:drug/metabolite transporter (DMT)-like permease